MSVSGPSIPSLALSGIDLAEHNSNAQTRTNVTGHVNHDQVDASWVTQPDLQPGSLKRIEEIGQTRHQGGRGSLPQGPGPPNT